MGSILLVANVVAAIIIIGLVLMQHGKGADMGASFGSGASQTMFGSSGSGNFLSRATTWMTVVFFATSLGLAVAAKQRSEQGTETSSLISGDVEQINNEMRAENQEDIPELSFDTIDFDDVPESDIPEVE